MSIWNKIGHFFVGLFNAMKKQFLNLSPEYQEALKQGTGFIGMINLMLSDTPEAVRKAIQERYPNISEEVLEQSVFKLLNTFHLTPVTNLDEAIAAIQEYLRSREDKTAWAEASHIGAVALSYLMAGPDSKFQIITLFVEWVYQHFFKKSTD